MPNYLFLEKCAHTILFCFKKCFLLVFVSSRGVLQTVFQFFSGSCKRFKFREGIFQIHLLFGYHLLHVVSFHSQLISFDVFFLRFGFLNENYFYLCKDAHVAFYKFVYSLNEVKSKHISRHAER